MATLGELCRQHTSLTRDEINHLKQLVSEWGLLADLCFADLLLYVPSTDSEWLIVAQVRPATGQTLYLTDYVGVPADNERPLLSSAFETSEISEGEIAVDGMPEPARMLAIPVRYGNTPIAVLSREWSNRTGRQPGELERTYLGIFQRFAAMIAEGSFPFHGLVGDSSAAPRVGDGVMVLDDEARVRYASPN
ncbi:MAG: two-component system, sensor histidine kinase PdtaS, partial [Ilumatobacteraceae bacterium]